MAHLYLLEIGAVALCLIIYSVVSYYVRERRFKAFAIANGCQLPQNASPANYLLAVREAWIQLFRIIDMASKGEDFLDGIFGAQVITGSTMHRIQFDGRQVVMTNEPANLQAVLATQFKDFEIGKLRIAQFYPILGTSIFSSDGSAWEHSRALFRPQFNREQINDLKMTEKASQDLIEACGNVDAQGWTAEVKMLPLLLNFTLDTATDFLFGESVGSQRRAMETACGGLSPQMATSEQQSAAEQAGTQQFSDDVKLSSEYMLARIRNQGLYWLADGFAFRAAIRRLQNFSEYYVRRALNPVAVEKNAGKKYNLLGALAKQTRDTDDLRNQTLAILFAGRDTTASMLGWSFARLSLHPQIYATLRESVLRDFGTSPDSINFTALKSCRYLQHFLNEVLRLHPLVPMNGRTATRDTTLPMGGGPDGRAPVAVRKGQQVLYSTYFLQRRQDLWGPDVLEFRPERWAERKIPAWQFIPFSGGPRICIGQQFALTEASYLLVRICQLYDRIEPANYAEMAKLKKGLGLVMWPADEARVRLHRAE